MREQGPETPRQSTGTIEDIVLMMHKELGIEPSADLLKAFEEISRAQQSSDPQQKIQAVDNLRSTFAEFDRDILLSELDQA